MKKRILELKQGHSSVMIDYKMIKEENTIFVIIAGGFYEKNKSESGLALYEWRKIQYPHDAAADKGSQSAT